MENHTAHSRPLLDPCGCKLHGAWFKPCAPHPTMTTFFLSSQAFASPVYTATNEGQTGMGTVRITPKCYDISQPNLGSLFYQTPNSKQNISPGKLHQMQFSTTLGPQQRSSFVTPSVNSDLAMKRHRPNLGHCIQGRKLGDQGTHRHTVSSLYNNEPLFPARVNFADFGDRSHTCIYMHILFCKQVSIVISGVDCEPQGKIGYLTHPHYSNWAMPLVKLLGKTQRVEVVRTPRQRKSCLFSSTKDIDTVAKRCQKERWNIPRHFVTGKYHRLTWSSVANHFTSKILQ